MTESEFKEIVSQYHIGDKVSYAHLENDEEYFTISTLDFILVQDDICNLDINGSYTQTTDKTKCTRKSFTRYVYDSSTGKTSKILNKKIEIEEDIFKKCLQIF